MHALKTRHRIKCMHRMYRAVLYIHGGLRLVQVHSSLMKRYRASVGAAKDYQRHVRPMDYWGSDEKHCQQQRGVR